MMTFGKKKEGGTFKKIVDTVKNKENSQKEDSKTEGIAGGVNEAGGKIIKSFFIKRVLPCLLIGGIIFAAVYFVLDSFQSILNIFSSPTAYNPAWNYESLDDKNLDTEVVSQDILYETFYEIVSETSYYQVFNTKYTVANQTNDFSNVRFTAFLGKNFEKAVQEGWTKAKNIFTASIKSVEDWLFNWTGFDNMDIRMTVHDANFRTISSMQKALSYSDIINPEQAAISTELSLFRDYYGRENDFAISTGLLKSLNDKVLNLPTSNANEDMYMYPETFTKPVQFTFDYYRVIPKEDEKGNLVATPYTYITRRVLYDDIVNGNSIWVTNSLINPGSKPENFKEVKVSIDEIRNKYDNATLTGASKLQKNLLVKPNDDVTKYDMEGFITSAPSPYLYEYIVLERNSRAGLQEAYATEFDYLALNNVSKYVTIQEYNDYSENPKESQVKLYWKIVKADSYDASILNENNEIDFTVEFGFTDKDEDGRPKAKDGAFYGMDGNDFKYISAETDGLRLVGPFASYENMLKNDFIGTTADILEGFDPNTQATIKISYDALTSSYAYIINYKKEPVRRKEVPVETTDDSTETEKPNSGVLVPNLDETEEVKYYEWVKAEEATDVTIVAEAILTFPERHYQLAPLVDEDENVIATSRVYVNTGEFNSLSVRDTYRRSMEYQTRLTSYLAQIIETEDFMEEIRGEFPVQHIFNSIAAFFKNMGRVGTLIQDALGLERKFLETATDAELLESYGRTDRENLIKDLEDRVAKAEDEEPTIVLGEKEMAYAIYKFETEVVIPQGKVGVELEHSGSFGNYSDTTGLESKVYQELEKRYDMEFQDDFKTYVNTFRTENGIGTSSVYAGTSTIEASLNPLPGELVTYDTAYGGVYDSAYWYDSYSPMNATSTTYLYPKYISSGYLPTSISYSFSESTASAGTDTGVVEIGAGEEVSLGYDFSGKLRRGETQLVNLLRHPAGKDLVKYYTGINFNNTDENNFIKLSQRYINVCGKNITHQSVTSKSLRLPVNDPSNNTTITIYTKKEMEQKYEYRVKSHIFDISLGRWRDGSTREIMPYEVRSVRDYGLASILEYIEGLSVRFKRGLFYDEQYQEYALNAFIYYVQKNPGEFAGLDVSSYDFTKTDFFDDLERGFWPGEYVDFKSDDFLVSEFILGGAAQMAEDIGQGSSMLVNNFTDGSGVNVDATKINGVGIYLVGDSSARYLNQVVDTKSMGVTPVVSNGGFVLVPDDGNASTTITNADNMMKYIENVNANFKTEDKAVILFMGIDEVQNKCMGITSQPVDDTGNAKSMDLSTVVGNKLTIALNKLSNVPSEKIFIVNIANVNPENADVPNDSFWSWLGLKDDKGDSIGEINNKISEIAKNGNHKLIDINSALDNWTGTGSKYDEGDAGYYLSANGYLGAWEKIVSELVSNHITTSGGNLTYPTGSVTYGDNVGNVLEYEINGTEKFGYIIDKNTRNISGTDGSTISKTIYTVIEKETNATKYIEYYKNADGNMIYAEGTSGGGTQTVQGTFMNNADSHGISANGTVINAESYLNLYYNDKQSGFRAPSIYFDCFVPYLKGFGTYSESKIKELTYKSPTDYYLSWLKRDEVEDTMTTAEKLAASRSWVVKTKENNGSSEYMITSEALAHDIKEYFKGNGTTIPRSFAANLMKSNGDLMYTELYNDTNGVFLTENVTKQTPASFGLNGMDQTLAQSTLTNKSAFTDGDRGKLINDYTWMDMTSTESMFLISQAVTFLGRFEYTYKDKMETERALSDYDKHRLVGLYYYDRYYEVEEPNIFGVSWDYTTTTFSTSWECCGSEDAPTTEELEVRYGLNSTQMTNLRKYLSDEKINELISKNQWPSNYSVENGIIIKDYFAISGSTTEFTKIVIVEGEDEEGNPTSEEVEETHYRYTCKYVVTYMRPSITKIESSGKSQLLFTGNTSTELADILSPKVRIYNDLMNDDFTEDYTSEVYSIDEMISNLDGMSIYKVVDEKADISKNMKFTNDVSQTGDNILRFPKAKSSDYYYKNNTYSTSEMSTNQTVTINSDTSSTTYYKYKNSYKNYSGLIQNDISIPLFITFNEDIYDYSFNKAIVKDNRIENVKTGDLKRNYFGANWRIYLKEMALYYDGETLKSWGDRVIFTDEELKIYNPEYQEFEEDIIATKMPKANYFLGYLMNFETYVPKFIKDDSDVQNRVDLVQNFASLTANGELFTTEDITDMFISEADADYWKGVYSVWDETFKDQGLANISQNQKIKAFAQILQGIWEARAQKAVTYNLEKLGRNIDSENETNIKIMNDIILRSCKQATSDTAYLRKYIEDKAQGFITTSGSPVGNVGITYEDFEYLGWAGLSVNYGIRQKTIKTVESNVTQQGLWYKSTHPINKTLSVEYDSSGKVVKDERLIATSVMTYMAHRLLSNLNKFNGIHQAIYATALTDSAMSEVVANSSTSDLTQSGNYPDGEIINTVFSYIKNINVRQTLAAASSASANVEIGKNAELTQKALERSIQEPVTGYGDDLNITPGLALEWATTNNLEYIWSTGDRTSCVIGNSSDIQTAIGYAVDAGLEYASAKGVNLNVPGDPKGFFTAYLAAIGMTESGLRPDTQNIPGKTYGSFQILLSHVKSTNSSVNPTNEDTQKKILYSVVWSACWTMENMINNYENVERKFHNVGYMNPTAQDVLLYLVNAHNKGDGGAESWLKGLVDSGVTVDANWPAQLAVNEHAYKYMLQEVAPSYVSRFESTGIDNWSSWGSPKYIEHVMEYLTDSFDFSSFTSGSLTVSSRSNVASQLKQMNLKDYRAYTSTSLELISRPLERIDAEKILREAPSYKKIPDKKISQMEFDELFVDEVSFNILDLLGNLNAKGLYERKNTTPFEYIFEGVYDGIDLGAVNWTTTDHGNTDIVAVALREAANEHDDWGRKYQIYNHYTPWVHWCACFVNWCAGQLNYSSNASDYASQALFYRSGGCSLMVEKTMGNCGAQIVTPSENPDPAPGDLIFFRGDAHIELVIGSDGSYVYTVGGNTSDVNGAYQAGLGGVNVVRVKKYDINNTTINRYIIPDYTRVEDEDQLWTLEDLLNSSDEKDYAGDGNMMTYDEYFNSIDQSAIS